MIDTNGNRMCFWLNLMEPDPDRKGSYRACLVTENVPGYSKMGDESKGQIPWYWDEKTCNEQNKRIGVNPLQAMEIVGRSMTAQFRGKRR